MPRRAFRLIVASSMLACAVLTSCQEKKKPQPPVAPPDAPASAPKTHPMGARPAPPAEQTTVAGLAASFPDDASLVKALRAGGYILAFRHTATDMTQKDEQGTDYANCAKQRNLTDAGREDAKKIGEAMRAAGVPISEVLTSPFCRNKETAELAFGKVTVNNVCMGEDPASIAARAQLLGTAPPAGTNLVMVTHRHSMDANIGTGLDMFGEGGAMVIIPKGGSEFQYVHTIHVTDWPRLVAEAEKLK